MSIPTFAESLAPDTINRLERAARQRYETGTRLLNQSRRLDALYLFGYCAEMCLATSYFRSWGFPPNAEIDRDLRDRHMKRARDLKLMSGDPHPIVGWAFLLQSQRILGGGLDDSDKIRLRLAIANADTRSNLRGSARSTLAPVRNRAKPGPIRGSERQDGFSDEEARSLPTSKKQARPAISHAGNGA